MRLCEANLHKQSYHTLSQDAQNTKHTQYNSKLTLYTKTTFNVPVIRVSGRKVGNWTKSTAAGTPAVYFHAVYISVKQRFYYYVVVGGSY